MNTKFGIKNFRVFDREGATFKIAPLTILTGCNSSGKSSMVKSMMLLGNYLKKIEKGFQDNRCTPSRYPLEFFGSDLRLGGFDNVRNKKSNPDEPITFSFYSRSCLLNATLKVEMSFKSSSKDTLNSGWLSDFALYLEDGTVLLKAVVKDNRVSFVEGNLLLLRETFFKYIKYEWAEILYSNSLTNYRLTKEQRDEYRNDSEQYRSELGEDHDSFRKARRVNFGEVEPTVVQSIFNQATLFAMPALTDLADAQKDDIMGRVALLLDKKQEGFGNDFEKEKTAFQLNRIAKDFMDSDFETFLDYFLDWEEKEWINTFFEDIFELASWVFDDGGIGIRILKRQEYKHSNSITYVLGFDIEDYENWVKETHDRDSKNDFRKGLRLLEKEIEKWQKNKELEKISFYMIWETLVSCSISDLKECDELLDSDVLNGTFNNTSCLYFIRFFQNVIKEALQPIDYTIEYVGSAAATVKRLYSFDAEEGTLEGKIKRYVNIIRDYSERFKGYNQPFEPGAFINKWIQKFGIGHSISFDQVEDGLGVSLRLHVDENDSKGHLLADEGYGITQLLSTLISIEIQIMLKSDTRHYVGKPDFSTISIEEPEIHLHPRYQSLLAEMFVDAYKTYKIHFIIETHSEYLIRKLQTYIPKGQVNEKEGLKPEEIALYYFYDPDPAKRPKNEPQIKKIGFRKDGSLDSAFGSGFFDEADNLAMSLLLGN